MSNLSLTGNPGTSLNFDGAALQNLQEAECRKEEEQQQNELRALLTNAFDDLIDEDDILSITSEEGTDSRNVSLIHRASNDSFGRLTGEENKIDEVPDTDNDWGGGYFQRPTSGIPDREHGPRFDFNMPLSRTQEFPRLQFDLVRASVESLPNIRGSNDPDADLRSNPSFHGSRDQLDSDYHSNTEETVSKKADFQGNVYPMESHLEGTNQAHNKKKKSQRKGQKEVQNDSKTVTGERQNGVQGHQDGTHMSTKERENILRKSIEDFAKFKHEALTVQGNEQFYGAHVAPSGGHEEHFQGQGHKLQNHHQWPTDTNQNAAERPYDENNPAHQHHVGQLPGHGNYYPDFPGQGHITPQTQEHVHQGYNQHYQDHHHHHFRNIYEGRPYHTIGEREETEGGNDQYYQFHDQYGYYQNNGTPYGNSTDRGFYSHATGFTDTQHIPSQTIPNDYHQSHPNIQNQRENQSHPNDLQNVNRGAPNEITKQSLDEHSSKNPLSPSQPVEGFPEGYKVNYQKGQDEKGNRPKKDKSEEKRQPDKSKEKMEKEFMQQGGSSEDQQVAQLQVLYKARGSKIEDLVNEMDLLKQGMGREIRILKHQLNMAKGEKEGAAKSLDNCQELLSESKAENAQLVGRVHAAESQIEGLKKGKEEMIKKLQTAESTIENLHQHLEELGRSDSLSRARHEHEVVVAGLQKKYETEIKVLKEQMDKINDSLKEKDDEMSTLKLKLADSRKTAENLQISRAETINRLTQSLEESQKRCRNLLESSSSQDMSQMKVQLQQALASKSISEEMCCSLQDEIKDLKEQLQMIESASSLGINGHASSTSTGFVDQNDSLIDLGIKKTLDYDTPQGTPTVLRSQSAFNTSNEVVSSLKAELERCLISNRQKRSQVMELKDDLKNVKKELSEYKQRCDCAELLSQEHKKRIADLESCVSTDDNVIENRLKKDIENLKREKKVLLDDIEEMQKRLDEISRSEEKLTELNQELSKQIADMVKEYDHDKREAVERVQRACDQVGETSRKQLREEMMLHFDTERSALIAKYEKELKALRDELTTAEAEVDKVKNVYVTLCEDKDKLEDKLKTEWTGKVDTELKKLKEALGKDHSLAVLRIEETLEKKRETEIEKLKQELKTEHETAISKLKTNFENERIKLETEKLDGIEKLQIEVKRELETEKSKLKTEFENEKLKLQNEKLQEIERISNEFKKRSIEIQEKDEVISVKDLEIMKIQEKYETEVKYLKEKFEEQLKSQKESAEKEKNTLQVKLENEIKTLQDILEKEKMNDIEKVKKEKVNEIERLKQEIVKLKLEIERLNKELEEQMSERVNKDKENKIIIDKFIKEIQEQKDKIEKSDKLEQENKTVQEKLKEKEVELERITEASDKENKALADRLMEKDIELERTNELSTQNGAVINTLKEKETELERKLCDSSVVIERLKKEKEEIEKQLKSMEDNIETMKVEFRDTVRTEMDGEIEKKSGN